jgi:hypothetical protein
MLKLSTPGAPSSATTRRAGETSRFHADRSTSGV